MVEAPGADRGPHAVINIFLKFTFDIFIHYNDIGHKSVHKSRKK